MTMVTTEELEEHPNVRKVTAMFGGDSLTVSLRFTEFDEDGFDQAGDIEVVLGALANRGYEVRNIGLENRDGEVDVNLSVFQREI